MNPAPLALVLLLTSCGKTLEPSAVERDAAVDEVGIQMLESFPVRVRAVVRGNFPDGCTRMSRVDQSREGNEFRLHLVTTRPKDAVCTEALVPYEEVVELDVAGLPKGDYRVVANGVAASFTLTADNRLSPRAGRLPGCPLLTQVPGTFSRALAFGAPFRGLWLSGSRRAFAALFRGLSRTPLIVGAGGAHRGER